MTLDFTSSSEATSPTITSTSEQMSAADVVTSRSERVGRLVRRAMILFDADRAAAWRYLSIASTLLTHKLGGMRTAYRVADRSYGLAPWQVKRVVDYINDNLQSKVDVDQLAKLVGVSKGHFSRALKRRVGLAPMTYVAVRRVERAKAMMTSSNEPLTEIAVACGFGDQPHMTRWFRRVVGVTPGLYRRINSQIGGAAIRGGPLTSAVARRGAAEVA